MSYPGVEDVAGVPVVEEAAQAVVSLEDPTAVPPTSPLAERYALTAWGAQFMRVEKDVVCPSGQRCRVRNLEIEDAMALGILDSLDIFTSDLMQNITDDVQAQAANDRQVVDALKDPEKRANFFGTVNRVVAHSTLIPKIAMSTDAEGNTAPGEVFAGDIPFEDKMHIFREVFNKRTQAVATFPEEQAGDLASVQEGEGVPLPAE